MKPNPTFHRASMFVVEECRDSPRQREPCRRCFLGRTTGPALLQRSTLYLQAGTELVVRQPFGPNNIPHSTSSVPLSSSATVVLEVTTPSPSFGFCEALGKSAQSRVASFPVTLRRSNLRRLREDSRRTCELC